MHLIFTSAKFHKYNKASGLCSILSCPVRLVFFWITDKFCTLRLLKWNLRHLCSAIR